MSINNQPIDEWTPQQKQWLREHGGKLDAQTMEVILQKPASVIYKKFYELKSEGIFRKDIAQIAFNAECSFSEKLELIEKHIIQ